MRNNENVNKRLRGYYPTFRGKYLLLKENILSQQAFLLYDVSVAIADWDKRHESYGVLGSTQEEIEHILGRTKGYVSRYGKELFNKGFWLKDQHGRTHVVGFELIETKLLKNITEKHKVVSLQDYIANAQQYSFVLQRIIAEAQLNTSKATNSFQDKNVADLQLSRPITDLVSSKGEYSLRDKSLDSGLSEEDKQWISENVKEEKEGGYD